jgi:hypothetical protein
MAALVQLVAVAHDGRRNRVQEYGGWLKGHHGNLLNELERVGIYAAISTVSARAYSDLEASSSSF